MGWYKEYLEDKAEIEAAKAETSSKVFRSIIPSVPAFIIAAGITGNIMLTILTAIVTIVVQTFLIRKLPKLGTLVYIVSLVAIAFFIVAYFYNKK